MASGRQISAAVILGLAIAALSGCDGSDAASSASSGSAAAGSTTTTTTTPSGSSGSSGTSGTTSTTVAITGTPVTSIKVGQKYAFAPHVAAKGSAKFSISNKPSWASFDAKSGQLSGTPAAKDVGTYHDVKISAALNGTSAALEPFDVTVQAAPQTQAQSQPVTLSWTAPSSAGSGQLEGYRIYYGTSAGALSHVVTLSASETSYVIKNLASGTWYFAMTSLNDSDVESARSAVVPAEI